MTLIVAINLNNYIILTGDHRLTIECQPFTKLPSKFFVDGYKKLKYWKHGAIVVSGSVVLMHYFYEFLQAQAPDTFDFLLAAYQARIRFLQEGGQLDQATGCAFFSVFNNGEVLLIHLSIKTTLVEYEKVYPIFAHFSAFEGEPDDPVFQEFAASLRQSFEFESAQAFYGYHVDLLKAFYRSQNSFDESVTSSFDLFIQDTKTGLGFTQYIDN